MAQQINLSTPILLAQKRYFSALALVQALSLLLLAGGGLSAYWVWSLNTANAGFQKTLAAQTVELASLQAEIANRKAAAGPTEVLKAQELQTRRAALAQREKLLDELQRGLYRAGWGHSARLQLVAQSIPAQVWVTELKADETWLEASGFTLDPAALNDWLAKLSASPLLKEQKLATVKVEHASPAMLKAAGGSARPLWSFQLLSAVTKPAAVVSGGKP
jgi:Tfp pilus assembly protein PilN